MSSSSLIGSSFNPFFLGLLVFLSCHMTFYVFSYSSLVFAIIVIYSTVFGMVYGEQIEQSCFALQSSFHKNFIATGFTPFTGSGWNNVEVDEKGNVIESSSEHHPIPDKIVRIRRYWDVLNKSAPRNYYGENPIPFIVDSIEKAN